MRVLKLFLIAFILSVAQGCSSPGIKTVIANVGYACIEAPRAPSPMEAYKSKELLSAGISIKSPLLKGEAPDALAMEGMREMPLGRCKRFEYGSQYEYHTLRKWEYEKVYGEFPDTP